MLRERAGLVRIRAGKGLKARAVPLNATARRALRSYLATREEARPTDPLFVSTRGGAMPTRTLQAVFTHLARRAKLHRLPVSARAHAAAYLCLELPAPESWQARRIGQFVGP